MVDDHSISTNHNMREAARANLYREELRTRPKLDNLHFKELGDLDQVYLQREFTEEGIRSCLMECNGDKVSGLDGFNMRFL